MQSRRWTPSVTYVGALLLLLTLGSGWTMGCEFRPMQAPLAGEAPLTLTGLAEAFPGASDLLARAEQRPVSLAADGSAYSLRLGPLTTTPSGGMFKPVATPVDVRLPLHTDEAVRLSSRDGAHIDVRRRSSLASECELDGGALLCERAASHVDAVMFAAGDALEELLLVHDASAELGYDIELPLDWRLVQVSSTVIEIRDGAEQAQMRVSATKAWASDGRDVPLSITLDDDGVALRLGEASSWPVLVDPAFTSASVPLKLRMRHTATLLGDGRVLLTGGTSGGTAIADAEIYDPANGTSTAVGSLSEPRQSHTATMLRDGRVLIAGGDVASGGLDTTELFDPVNETFAIGPQLAAGRANHTATRLEDGRVLIAGGDGGTAEIFDPTNDTLTATGSMNIIGSEHAAARLLDGRVLVVDSYVAELFDPAAAGGVGAFSVTGGPTTIDATSHTLTVLHDGKVLLVGGCPCSSVGGPVFSSFGAELYDPGTGLFTATGDTTSDRLFHSASLLPSGKVLLVGSDDSPAGTTTPEQFTGELYDPDAGTFTALADKLASSHGQHTATVLASSDVLIFGGDQAAAEMYVGGGSDVPGQYVATTGNLTKIRVDHRASLLDDGDVLLTGGLAHMTQLADDTAETYDPDTGLFTATAGDLAQTRVLHSSTLLRDGTVLIAGGYGGTEAELYDASTRTFTTIAAAMTAARSSHTATMLPSGKVLLTGGDGELDSAELYDPRNGTFTATSNDMTDGRSDHAAVLLPTGDVLIVGADSADLYDPVADTFVATGSPAVSYSRVTLALLESGNVLVSGSATFAAEIYDHNTETFTFTGEQASGRWKHDAIVLPTGQVIMAGGQGFGLEPPTYASAALYDSTSWTFTTTANMVLPRTQHTTTLLLTGEVLLTGGVGCVVNCFSPHDTAELYQPVVRAGSIAPAITNVPATAIPGQTVDVTGTDFDTQPESSDGRGTSSASNHPVVVWQPSLGSGLLRGRVASFSDNSLRWEVPATALYGPGKLHVVVNGISSAAVPLEITATPSATSCKNGGQCDSGFCVDGLCCDTACDQVCEACTAALKGSGSDGVCGTVPADQAVDDDCVVSQGAPCTADGECETGLCVDAVCCDASCTGQCEACDVAGSVGVCVPVQGPPHGERPSCNASPPTDPCDTKLCDGVDRTSCAATVGPCTPYACGESACITVCETDGDCGTGFHCDNGECIGGVCDGSIAVTTEGVTIDCSPYLCRADGSCKETCADVSDCLEPFACNFEGRCVSRPPVDAASGCSHHPSRPGSPPADGLGVLLLAGLGLGLIRRRHATTARAGAVLLAVVLLHSPSMARAQPIASPSPASSAADTESTDEAKPSTPSEGPPSAADPAGEEATAATKAAARERFDKGLALIRDKAWAPALAEFLASRAMYATRVATNNIAFCYRRLERYDEALDMYETLLREFEDMPDDAREAAMKDIAALRLLVGSIEIDAAEIGAVILIDGRTRGTYPTLGPLRAPAGSHVVRVHKEGFEPFETSVDLAGGSTIRVRAPLSPLTDSGHLSVTETSNKKLRVFVDNIEVGETPWQGRLSLGKHTVRLMGEGKLGTQPAAALIESQQTTTLTLSAELLEASLRVAPTPASAMVIIDSVEVGRGVWEGALRAGEHKIEITETGFFAFNKRTVVERGQSETLSVELERDESADIWQLPSKFVIDMTAAGAIAPSFGGDVTGTCDAECSQSAGLGVLTQIHIGYELGSGFGFGVAGGFLEMQQSVDNRTVNVEPVGLSPRQGTSTDTLRIRGVTISGWGSYIFGQDYPLLLRFGAGPVFASVRDTRTGSFTLETGGTYQAGPVEQEPSAMYLHLNPEVRAHLPIGDHFAFSLGLEVPVFIAISQPEWDNSDEVDAAADGIGAFSSEAVTGRVLVAFAPGLGARAQF